jgi:hypothetical protein
MWGWGSVAGEPVANQGGPPQLALCDYDKKMSLPTISWLNKVSGATMEAG